MSRDDQDGFTGFSGAAWTQAVLDDDATALSDDRYRIDGELGRGGMGVVLLATDRWLGRQVALKRPRVGVAQSIIDRMVREASITGRLVHPSIPPVLDVGEDAEGPYYTVPVLNGTPLSRYQPEHEVGWVQAVRDVARALGHAHEHGVVHRDLKPDNVLVGPHAEVWVLDWGVAFDAANPDGSVVGTPGWSAPEQAQGTCSPASDVYALGRLLEGHAPDDALVAVVQRACSSKPEERYATANQLADELDRWLGGQRVLAHAYSPSEILAVFARQYSGRLVAAAAVLAVTVIGLMGALYLQSVERSRTEEALARGLAVRASLASADGARAEAELLAVASLELRDSPQARGVLVRWGATRRPTAVGHGRVYCDQGWRFDGTQACHEGDELVVYGNDGPIDRHGLPKADSIGLGLIRLYDDALLTASPTLGWQDGHSVLLAGHPGPWHFSEGSRAVFTHAGTLYEVDGLTRRVLAEGVCADASGVFAALDRVLVTCPGRVQVVQGERLTELAYPGEASAVLWVGTPVVMTFQGDVLVRRAGAWQVIPTNAGPVDEASVLNDTQLVVTTEEGVTRILDVPTGRWLVDLPRGFRAATPTRANGDTVRLFGGNRWIDYADALDSIGSLDLSADGGVGGMAWQGPDGRIAVGSATGSVVEWDPATGQTRTLWRGGSKVAKAIGWFQGQWLYQAPQIRHGSWRFPDEVWFSRALIAGDVALLLGYGGHLTAFDGENLTNASSPVHISALAAHQDEWWAAYVTGRVARFRGLEPEQEWELADALHRIAASNEHVLGARDSTITLYTHDGQAMWSTSLPSQVTVLAVSERYAVAGLRNGSIWVHDLRTGEPLAILSAHTRRVSALLLSGTTLVSASWDGWVHRLDLSVLDKDPSTLKPEVEASWGMTAQNYGG